MELTVLGKSPSWQDRDGACSAYLVRVDGFAVMVDCGSGVFAKLRTAIDYLDVDAILLTHMHPDHTLDLLPFACALSYSPRRLGRVDAPRPALHVPDGGRDTLRRLGAAFDDEGMIERAFALTEYAPDAEVDLGPLGARFCEVPHFVRAFAAELRRHEGGKRLIFGADCGPNAALEEFAQAADLLVLEATQVAPGEGFRGHMTAREAGELGRRAGARRLLVSHFSDELDPDRVRDEAAAGFGGAVEIAQPGARLDV